MKTATKTILLAGAIVVLSISKSFSAMDVTKNPLTGELMYHAHFMLNNELTSEQAFALVQKWFTESPDKFTATNTKDNNIATRDLAQKTKVEQSFKNSNPLVSTDVQSNWAAGNGLVKYYGGQLSTIWLMFVEYDVVVEVQGHEVSATISHIRYHHFSPYTYAPMPIAKVTARPYPASGKFETLSPAITDDQNLSDLNDFLNNNIRPPS